jgi:conjugal transfer pilin signal peptidase TrbI
MENTTEQHRTTFFTFRRSLAVIVLVSLVLATNVGITHLMLTHTTPRVVAFDMKKARTVYGQRQSEAAVRGAVKSALRPL